MKTGPEFDSRQLQSGSAGTAHAHHEEVYDDHGHHVKGTAGVTGTNLLEYHYDFSCS